MVSLVYIVINLFRKNKIIQLRRLPPTKVLRIHQIGLTLGLFFVLLSIAFSNNHIYTAFPVLFFSLMLIIFIGGTITGGPFVFLNVLYLLIFQNSSGIFADFHSIAQWYLWGYAFGVIFSILYNDFVFLHTVIFCRKKMKVVFAFDPKKKVNIIKSPDEREEISLLEILKPLFHFTQRIMKNSKVDIESTNQIMKLISKAYHKMLATDKNILIGMLPGNSDDNLKQKLENLKIILTSPDDKARIKMCDDLENNVEPLIEKYLKLKESKLYNYKIKPPVSPYTIAFIVNPHISLPDNPGKFKIDPLIKNRELFLRSIDMALHSFEQNEVLGRPEIWSRIRIVAIFDDDNSILQNAQYNMVQPNPDIMEFDDVVADNLLVPTEQVKEIYQKIIESSKDNSELSDDRIEAILRDTDVIFAMSAVPEFERSCSRFTDWIEGKFEDPNKNAAGKSYDFDQDPTNRKEGEIRTPTFSNDGPFSCLHEYYAKNPGRVALNVLGANIKTYIHEFAHAMSSAYHGAVVDEYFDSFEMHKTGEADKNDERLDIIPFYVNRVERNQKGNSVIPVHKIFARYNGTTFYSNLNHPSTDENWIGYFPELKSTQRSCIMDRSYNNNGYQFDELLSVFLYDRIITKINRSPQ